MSELYSCHRNPPTPGAPVNISAATITSHAIPRLNRNPVNIYGSVAGISTLKSVFVRESFNTFATFRKSCGIARTPTAVFKTVGHIAQTAMVNSAEGSGFWNSTNPNGSHASGDTGRRI